MRPTVYLFDIDGTLIGTAGAGRRAIEETFHRLYGRRDAVKFPFDGMTDPAIVTGGLERLGVPPERHAEETAAVLDAYVGVLTEVVAAATTFRIHAGMEQALDRLATRAGSAIGLGTGNVATGARIKLERVGLYQRFAFGGYGSDHLLRPELIRIGAERGAAQLGLPRASCRVVIIGDTPKDVAAAQAIGAESIGVGTGSYTPEALRACGATHAFPDLAAAGALEALLG